MDSNFAQSEVNATQQQSSIVGFRDFEWGTDQSSVESAIITSDMQNGTDYNTGEESGYYGIQIINTEVAGYKTNAAYFFQNSQLSFGLYDLTVDDSNFQDLVAKYTDKYGSPAAQQESIGWGPCAVWVDSNKNFIVISGFLNNILYISSGCPYTDSLADMLPEYHNINLQDLLEQSGNTTGV
ncbi:MAG: hypothetical protein Q4C66_13390 [Lachnospiraceae bacterium]|nr:hypothetical protein [Lachnospiraceae bacterium]